MQHFILSFKSIIIAGVVLISIACADYWYNDYKSLFYPEIAEKPSGTQPYFYTPQFLFSYDIYDYYTDLSSTHLSDSLNTDAWYQELEGKVDRNVLKTGLYEKNSALAKRLHQLKYLDVLQYLILVQRIDSLKAKPSSSWDTNDAAPADVIGLENTVSELEKLKLQSKKNWLNDRCLYAQLKALRFAGKNSEAIQLFEKGERKLLSGLIPDMTRSLYAGAFYHNREVARSYYEFSKLLASPSIGNQVPFNIRVYDMPFGNDVLKYCKNDKEKADVHTIAALQPRQNLVMLTRKVFEYAPEHPYLPLLVSRMINKHEEFQAISKEKNKEWWSSEDSLAHIIPNGELDSILQVTFDIAKVKNLTKEPFYAYAMSHLYYTSHNFPMAKLWTSIATVRDKHEIRQKYTQEVLNFLALPKAEDEVVILNKINWLSKMNYGRDVFVMQTISEGLSKYYSQDNVKSFYASSLKAISLEANWDTNETWYEFGGNERQIFLDSLTTDQLKPVVNHRENGNIKGIDSLLVAISNISKDELYLTYARRLMTDGKWKDAKIYFQKMDHAYLTNRLKGLNKRYQTDELISYSSPKLWLKSQVKTPIKDHLKYLDDIIIAEENLTKKPQEATLWYNFALHQLNLTYWGNAWIFAKSKWSTIEEPKACLPKSDISTYYNCAHVVESLDNAIKYCGDDHELQAKIIYLRALIEKYQAFVATDKLYVNPYWTLSEEDQKAIEIKAKSLVNANYSTYIPYFKEKMADSKYKRMVIEECAEIRNYKK